MLKLTSIVTAATLFATTAIADPVAERRAAMDQVRFGAATLVPMIKGEADFDKTIAELALRMTYAGSIAFKGDLFPQGSESKGANPDIWSNMADFDEKRANFMANAAAAVANLPTDLDGLKAVYQPLLKDCAACHKPYRIKDK